MTIEQLQYFCAVCQYQTFSKAALEMNITQSALSKQIAKLEQELDVLLFDRSHRQVTLTTYGQALFQDISDIVSKHQELYNHLQKIKQIENNTIK